MFTVSHLIIQLYPHKTLEEQKRLADRCLRDGQEYLEKSWGDVTREQLFEEEIQLNIARTIFRLQDFPSGVAQMMLLSLEDWSAGMLKFPDFPKETEEFYVRSYAFMGFLCFPFIGAIQQVFLLSTRLLPLACLWEAPVYGNIRRYFARMLDVKLMKQDAALFADAIEGNETVFGDPGQSSRSIQEWVRLFNEFQQAAGIQENIVDEFFVNKVEAQRLNPDEHNILIQILLLYHGLKTGRIWQELDDFLGPLEKSSQVDVKKPTEYALEVLKEWDAAAIAEWLGDHANATDWMVEQNVDRNWILQVIAILKEKMSVILDEHVEGLVGFFSDLKEKGLFDRDDIVYFDEKKG
ncbi:MAG: hypothetical protein AAB932_05675, partial [Patescibacteria group bacterium]